MKKATKSTKSPVKAGLTAKSQLKRLCVQDPLKMTEVIQKLEKDKKFFETGFWKLYPWHACDDCHKHFGAKTPPGLNCNTVMDGTCPICEGGMRTLVPTRDYIWPGKTYIWD